MSSDLKPCPFCGEKDGEYQVTDVYRRHFVMCAVCESRGPTGITKWEARCEWNQRAINE